MSYKRILSRWIHKRLSHNYTQASLKESDSFRILATTIIRDSGMKQYERIRINIAEIKKSLDELIDKKVILSYHTENTIEGRTIVDAMFTLTPSESFVKEMKWSNARYRDMTKVERERKLIADKKKLDDEQFERNRQNYRKFKEDVKNISKQTSL